MKIQVRRVELNEAPLVQKILEGSPTYFKNLDGTAVLSHFAVREMTDAPKNKDPLYEKWFCVVEINGETVGVVDFHRNCPSPDIAYIGLFLLVEEVQKQGWGRLGYDAVEFYAKEVLAARKIMLGVATLNDIEGFWIKMGYRRNGRTYEWKGEALTSPVNEMEKEL